jgi:hypothetical protein
MGVAPCSVCSECESTLAQHSGGHYPPKPHEFETLYDEKTGKPYAHCKRCHKRVEKEAPLPPVTFKSEVANFQLNDAERSGRPGGASPGTIDELP